MGRHGLLDVRIGVCNVRPNLMTIVSCHVQVVSVDVDARTEDVSYEFQVGSRFFSTKTTKREAPRPFAAKPSC